MIKYSEANERKNKRARSRSPLNPRPGPSSSNAQENITDSEMNEFLDSVEGLIHALTKIVRKRERLNRSKRKYQLLMGLYRTWVDAFNWCGVCLECSPPQEWD